MGEHDELAKAISEAKKLAGDIKPLTAILLVAEYHTVDLYNDIQKIESKVMARIDSRIHNLMHYIDRRRDELNRLPVKQPTTQEAPMPYYTIKEFALLTKSSVGHIRNLIKNKQLGYKNHAQIGSKNKMIRISQNDLDEYLKHKA